MALYPFSTSGIGKQANWRFETVPERGRRFPQLVTFLVMAQSYLFIAAFRRVISIAPDVIAILLRLAPSNDESFMWFFNLFSTRR